MFVGQRGELEGVFCVCRGIFFSLGHQSPPCLWLLINSPHTHGDACADDDVIIINSTRNQLRLPKDCATKNYREDTPWPGGAEEDGVAAPRE